MKVDAKKLANFLRKVTLNGDLKDCAMKFEPDGLRITLVSEGNTGAISGLMPSSNFVDYKTGLVATVKDVPLLLSLLKDFVGSVDISITDNNKLKLGSDKKDAEMSMPSIEFVVHNLDKMLELNHDGGFTVDASTLMNAKKDADRLKAPNVIMAITDKNLTITAGESNFNKLTTKDKVDYRDTACKYGGMLMKVINVLDGQVTVSLNEDFPCLITSKSEEYFIRWLVAPVGKEEQTAE